jgi:S1-C subfamily serine protease
MAKIILQGILADGHFRRGWLGAEVQEVDVVRVGQEQRSGGPGLRVTKVHPESPAAKAGILVGDTVVTLNGQEVRSSHRLRTLVLSSGAGARVQIGLLRLDGVHAVNIVLVESPMSTNATAAEPPLRQTLPSDARTPGGPLP